MSIPLQIAARRGDLGEIRRLVRAGADLEVAYEPWGARIDTRTLRVTPLMAAAGSAEGATVDTLYALLELGADARTVADGRSAAEWALVGLGCCVGSRGQGGDASRARALLDAGSPLPAGPVERDDLLCSCILTQDVERINMLLRLGFDPNGDVDSRERVRRSAHVGNWWLASRGIGGIDPDEPASHDANALEIIELAMSQTAWSASTQTPLHCAVRSGSVSCVQALLLAGADPFRHEPSRPGSVHGAPRGVPALGESHAMPLLLANAIARLDGDELGSLLRARIASGHAVSEFAWKLFNVRTDSIVGPPSEDDMADVLGRFLDLGVDLEHRSSAGLTPLTRAVLRGTAGEVRVLCPLGADVHARCRTEGAGVKEELPPLFSAGLAFQGASKIEALLDAGADPMAVDSGGRTAREHAARALDECWSWEDVPHVESRRYDLRRCVRILETAERRYRSGSAM